MPRSKICLKQIKNKEKKSQKLYLMRKQNFIKSMFLYYSCILGGKER